MLIRELKGWRSNPQYLANNLPFRESVHSDYHLFNFISLEGPTWKI